MTVKTSTKSRTGKVHLNTAGTHLVEIVFKGIQNPDLFLILKSIYFNFLI